MKLKDGGPAFPVEAQLKRELGEVWNVQTQNGDIFQFAGLTIRDYFAIKSLPIAWDALNKGYFESDDHNADLAASAYQLADAMLAERSKP